MNGLSVVDRSLADGRTLVEVTGEVDVYSSPVLREHLADLIADGAHDLVVDLRPVTFMDSTGLGVLVSGLKMASARDGSFELVLTAPKILKIFTITGLNRLFRIHPDAPSAQQLAPHASAAEEHEA